LLLQKGGDLGDDFFVVPHPRGRFPIVELRPGAIPSGKEGEADRLI